MTGPGRTLFTFVRRWSRHGDGGTERGRDVLVTEAVLAVSARGPATINAVAREIGIDQSGASRLVRDATDAGYLQPARSAEDGRRREVAVTDAGHELLRHAHRWQEEVFEQLTAGWTARERSEFHRALRRILEQSRA